MGSACCLCVGRAHQGNNGSASASVWQKAALPALPQIAGNSMSSYMSFKLLPSTTAQHKSMLQPFKRNCQEIKWPSLVLSLNPHWFFSARGYEDVSSWYWNPGWDPSIFRNIFAAEIFPSKSYLPHVGVRLTCSVSLSLLPGVVMWL